MTVGGVSQADSVCGAICDRATIVLHEAHETA
jgi:hypothetical protein